MTTNVRVLIVDADVVGAEAARAALKNTTGLCFRVDGCDYLESALRLLAEYHYDVLLVDLDLPDEHGIAVLEILRDKFRDIPVIVLSQWDDEATTGTSFAHGAQDCLIKGQFTDAMLVTAIRYAIYRQAAVNEMAASNERLGKLYETAYQFVDNVSHEFRTPLTVIKEYASLVREGMVVSSDEQHRFLDIVADRADDLNTMVDDMLDVSKLEAGQLGVWRRDCSVADILRGLESSLERKAILKGVTLQNEIDPWLPNVYCDDEKIGRVIINLTVNAIKFCQNGGTVRIWANTCDDAAAVVVGVTDDGPGIDEHNLARIFQRFQQVQGDARDACKGFGLGLSIAKELVDLNFGQMNVSSTLGEGSTFSFTLPVAEPMEIMKQYLHRVGHIHNGSTKVSLVTAGVNQATDTSATEDIDAYLHCLLRRNDISFRLDQHRWLLVVAANESEVDALFEEASRTMSEVNRNRIHGPLPSLEWLETTTWRVHTQSEDLFEHLREVLRTRGDVLCHDAY